MTDQIEGEDSAQDIQRQFAQLQLEMKRVMAEPAAGDGLDQGLAGAHADATADIERIERGLDDLRRDADRLRARMAITAESAGASEAISALRTRIEEIGKLTEESAARLNRAMQGNREAIAAVSLKVEELVRRRPSRWLVPLAILLGAAAIAAAALLGMPGRLQMLIDRAGVLGEPPKPHAEIATPHPPPSAAPEATIAPSPSPAAPPIVAESPPPVAPPIVAVSPPLAAPPKAAEPTVAPPAPPAAPAAVAVVDPPAPIPAPTPAQTPAQTPTPAATAPAIADVAPQAGQIVLRAKADTWVDVRNRQGVVLIARVLHAGETWAVPDQPSLMMTTGNAGGLDLLVDGTLSPSLGAVGSIRRDVPLDADLVRAGRYAPNSATPKPSTASR